MTRRRRDDDDFPADLIDADEAIDLVIDAVLVGVEGAQEEEQDGAQGREGTSPRPR